MKRSLETSNNIPNDYDKPLKKRKITQQPSNDNTCNLVNNNRELPRLDSLSGVVLHAPAYSVKHKCTNNHSNLSVLIPHASLDTRCTFCDLELSGIINTVQTTEELSKMVFICYYCRKFSHIGCIYNTLAVIKEASKGKKIGQVCEIKCGYCDFRYRTIKRFDTKTKDYTPQQDTKRIMNRENYKLLKSKKLIFIIDREEIYDTMIDPILFSQNWFNV